jgi:hypothetical protein
LVNFLQKGPTLRSGGSWGDAFNVFSSAEKGCTEGKKPKVVKQFQNISAR